MAGTMGKGKHFLGSTWKMGIEHSWLLTYFSSDHFGLTFPFVAHIGISQVDEYRWE